MHYYDLYSFKNSLEIIERFFVEIAANEDELLTYGFKRALAFPSAKQAMEALVTFAEDFSAAKRYALRMDRILGQELEQLDGQGGLVEQVSLIALRLRMTEVQKRPNLLLAIDQLFRIVKRKDLFHEEAVSLNRTIINLERLRGIITILLEQAAGREMHDDEVFKPSNVKPDRVIDLIDAALGELELLSSISATERQRLEGYLHEAKKEALSTSPSWSKIVGALVIVAAITSGLADAPNAARNVKEAIEYILGTSVEKPLQRYLPPEKQEPERPPMGTIA